VCEVNHENSVSIKVDRKSANIPILYEQVHVFGAEMCNRIECGNTND